MPTKGEIGLLGRQFYLVSLEDSHKPKLMTEMHPTLPWGRMGTSTWHRVIPALEQERHQVFLTLEAADTGT